MTCVCGHGEVEHQHYRAGTECASHQCGCRRYRPTAREHTKAIAVALTVLALVVLAVAIVAVV